MDKILYVQVKSVNRTYTSKSCKKMHFTKTFLRPKVNTRKRIEALKPFTTN